MLPSLGIEPRPLINLWFQVQHYPLRTSWELAYKTETLGSLYSHALLIKAKSFQFIGVTFFSKFYNPNLHNIARSDRIGFKSKNPLRDVNLSNSNILYKMDISVLKRENHYVVVPKNCNMFVHKQDHTTIMFKTVSKLQTKKDLDAAVLSAKVVGKWLCFLPYIMMIASMTLPVRKQEKVVNGDLSSRMGQSNSLCHSRVFHKLDEIGNNANIGIGFFTT